MSVRSVPTKHAIGNGTSIGWIGCRSMAAVGRRMSLVIEQTSARISMPAREEGARLAAQPGPGETQSGAVRLRRVVRSCNDPAPRFVPLYFDGVADRTSRTASDHHIGK